MAGALDGREKCHLRSIITEEYLVIGGKFDDGRAGMMSEVDVNMMAGITSE